MAIYEVVCKKGCGLRFSLEMSTPISHFRLHCARCDSALSCEESGGGRIDPCENDLPTQKEEGPPSRIGEYEILSTLKHGPKEGAYRGKSKGGEEVFLKVVDARGSSLLLPLKRKIISLSHPNLATCLDILEYQEKEVIVTEFVKGPTLESMVEEKNAWLTPYWIACIGYYAIQVEEYLGSQSLFHGNIKPGNVVFCKKPDGKTSIKLVNMTFGIPGSPGNTCVAPEIFSGTTPQTEVFAIGATLYHAFALKPLPLEWHDSALFSSLSVRRILPEIPEELENIIKRSIHPSASCRYPSFGEMKKELHRFMSKTS